MPAGRNLAAHACGEGLPSGAAALELQRWRVHVQLALDVRHHEARAHQVATPLCAPPHPPVPRPRRCPGCAPTLTQTPSLSPAIMYYVLGFSGAHSLSPPRPAPSAASRPGIRLPAAVPLLPTGCSPAFPSPQSCSATLSSSAASSACAVLSPAQLLAPPASDPPLCSSARIQCELRPASSLVPPPAAAPQKSYQGYTPVIGRFTPRVTGQANLYSPGSPDATARSPCPLAAQPLPLPPLPNRGLSARAARASLRGCRPPASAGRPN